MQSSTHTRLLRKEVGALRACCLFGLGPLSHYSDSSAAGSLDGELRALSLGPLATACCPFLRCHTCSFINLSQQKIEPLSQALPGIEDQVLRGHVSGVGEATSLCLLGSCG